MVHAIACMFSLSCHLHHHPHKIFMLIFHPPLVLFHVTLSVNIGQISNHKIPFTKDRGRRNGIRPWQNIIWWSNQLRLSQQWLDRLLPNRLCIQLLTYKIRQTQTLYSKRYLYSKSYIYNTHAPLYRKSMEKLQYRLAQ